MNTETWEMVLKAEDTKKQVLGITAYNGGIRLQQGQVTEYLRGYRFQGLYAQEEFQNVSDVKLDTEKVVADEIKENANSVDFDEDNIIDVEPTDTADK